MRKSYILAGILCIVLLAGIFLWEKIFPPPTPPPIEEPAPTRIVDRDKEKLPPIEVILDRSDEDNNERTPVHTPSPQLPENPEPLTPPPNPSNMIQPMKPSRPSDPTLPTSNDLTKIPPVYGGEGGEGGPKTLLDLIDVDRRPEPVYQAQPQYPHAAKVEGKNGTVIVYFVVKADGTTRDVRVVQSSDNVFDSAAVSAVEKWRFRPAMKDGVPVAVRVQMPLAFNIEDAE